jgi:hypothetical protein
MVHTIISLEQDIVIICAMDLFNQFHSANLSLQFQYAQNNIIYKWTLVAK